MQHKGEIRAELLLNQHCHCSIRLFHSCKASHSVSECAVCRDLQTDTARGSAARLFAISACASSGDAHCQLLKYILAVLYRSDLISFLCGCSLKRSGITLQYGPHIGIVLMMRCTAYEAKMSTVVLYKFRCSAGLDEKLI